MLSFLGKLLLGAVIIAILVVLTSCVTVQERVQEVRCSPVKATRCAGQTVQVCTADGPWMMVADCLAQGPGWRCIEEDDIHFCDHP